MPSFETHWRRPASVLFTLTLLLVDTQLQSQGNEQASPPVVDAELARQHDQLTSRVHACWQEGEDAQAYAGLQELLTLYGKIYPSSAHSEGHPHIVNCYRDLCRVSQKLGEIDAMQRYGEEGLAMCRQLFSQQKYPHGHVEIARMMANLAHALSRQGQPAKAREYLLESIRMSDGLSDRGLMAFAPRAIVDLHLSIASCCALEGDDRQTRHYTTLALKRCRGLPDNASYLDRVRLLARCLLEHGRAMINVGDYATATDALRQCIDQSFHVFLAEQSTRSRLALIDAHIQLGILYRLKSDLPNAKWQMRHALQEIENGKVESSEIGGREKSVLLQLLWASKLEGDKTSFRIHARRMRDILLEDVSIESTQNYASFARVNWERGKAFLILGELGQAESCLRTAHSCVVATDRSDAIAAHSSLHVLTNDSLGDFYQASGRYESAHYHFTNALSSARKIFPPEDFPVGHRRLAESLQDNATLLWLVGETESAAGLYREAMLMDERLYPAADYPRGHRQLMAAYSAWGNVLAREGDSDGAAEYFAKAHRIAVAQFPEAEYPGGHDELALVWRDLGRLAREQSRFEIALEYFQKALASYRGRYSEEYSHGHLLVALALSELGRTHCAAGDYEQAEHFLQQSLAIRRRLFLAADYPHGHPSLATALRDLGTVYQASDRNDKAFVAFCESARIEQAVAESFAGGGSEALLLNLAARKFQSLDCLLDVWCRSDLPAAEAYRYVWRRRGFVPRLIAQRYRAWRQIVADGAVADRDAYLDVRRELSRTLLVSAARDDEGESMRLETIRELNVRKENLEVHLTHQLPANKDDLSNERNPQHLASILPASKVLVDYVRFDNTNSYAVRGEENSGAAQLLAFVIAQDQPIVCVRLGKADYIEDLARRWRSAVLDGRDGGLGNELRQLVWDPVCRSFPDGAESVYIAPDGDLSQIPWNALPLPGGHRLLIEQYAIATVPHGTFLLEALKNPPKLGSETGRVLAVGDLDYGPQPDEDGPREMGLKQVTWRPLQGSGRELEELAAVAGQRECVWLTGADATAAAVTRQLPDCRWAHFASHGFFLDESLRRSLHLVADLEDGHELDRNQSRTSALRRSPFVRSGLALSGANILGSVNEFGIPRELTGILTAERIAAVDCGTLELVVLSACESGRGDVVHGDGVFGIQTAFHVAGARNVIASLWKIDDQATADLMGAFYRLLWAEERTPLAALRGAQLEMLRRSRDSGHQTRGPVLSGTVPLPRVAANSRRSPAFNARQWAGFILSGPGF